MPHTPVAGNSPSIAPESSPAGAMIARQAIMNGQQAVVGYELFNRSRSGHGHTAATDVFLVFTALSHAGSEELVGKKLIFVNCTHESLSGGHLELVDPDKVVLEIPPLGHAAAEEVSTRLPILSGLRERASTWPSTTRCWNRPMHHGCRWPTTSSSTCPYWRRTSWPCSSNMPGGTPRPS